MKRIDPLLFGVYGAITESILNHRFDAVVIVAPPMFYTQSRSNTAHDGNSSAHRREVMPNGITCFDGAERLGKQSC